MTRRRHGHALRRRYGHAGGHRPFQVVYDWAGVPFGQGLTPTVRFADANRAAMEVVRSGKSKRAAVIYTEPKPKGDTSPFRSQKLAEYVLGPGGGVMSRSVS